MNRNMGCFGFLLQEWRKFAASLFISVDNFALLFRDGAAFGPLQNYQSEIELTTELNQHLETGKYSIE